jgi:hypothetical protein
MQNDIFDSKPARQSIQNAIDCARIPKTRQCLSSIRFKTQHTEQMLHDCAEIISNSSEKPFKTVIRPYSSVFSIPTSSFADSGQAGDELG